MSRKVTIKLEFRLVATIDEGIDVGEVVNEIDYRFHLPDCATLEDAELTDYEVVDSK